MADIDTSGTKGSDKSDLLGVILQQERLSIAMALEVVVPRLFVTATSEPFRIEHPATQLDVTPAPYAQK